MVLVVDRLAQRQKAEKKLGMTGQRKNVMNATKQAMKKYSSSSIQNGCLCKMIASLIVPPPMAVIVPIAVAPNTSMPQLAAVILPDIAKTSVPK